MGRDRWCAGGLTGYGRPMKPLEADDPRDRGVGRPMKPLEAEDPRAIG
jgi:hypothetical protein